MANYNVTFRAIYEGDSNSWITSFDQSSVSLIGGDTITFSLVHSFQAPIGTTATISGLSIFTNNATFQITQGSSVTRTVAAGGSASDSVSGDFELGGFGATFTVNRQEVFPASPTASNQSVPYGTSSVSVPIFGGVVTAEAYSLCVTPGLTTNVQVVDDRISAMTPYGGGNFTISSGELPATGSSRSYYIYSYRYTTYNGAGQYYYASSFSVEVLYAEPSTSATCANTSIAAGYTGGLTLQVINASFSTDAYRLCRTGGTKTFSQIVADQIGDTIFVSSGTTFTIPEGELPGVGATEDYTVYAYRYPAYGGEGVYKEAGTFTVTRNNYVPPDRFITFPTSVSIAFSATSASIPLTGASSFTTYRIYNGGTLLQQISGGASATFTLSGSQLPAGEGQSIVYTIYCFQSTANGGNGIEILADGNISPPNVTITRGTSSPPDTTVTIVDNTTARRFASNATSFVLSFTGGTLGDEYNLRLYDGGAENGSSIGVSTADGSGNFSFTISSGFLPAAQGDTQWYSLYAARPIGNGGNGDFVYVTGLANSIWLSRRLATPSLTISDNDFPSETVGIIQNITNNATVTPTSVILRQFKNGAVLGSQQEAPWTGNGAYGGYFTQPRNTGSDTYFYNAFLYYAGTGTTPEARIDAYSFSISRPADLNYQPGYIPSDDSVTIGNIPTAPLAYNDTSDLVLTISGRESNNAVRIVKSTAPTVSIGIFSALNNTYTLGYVDHLPDPGTTTNYLVQIQRSTANGGDGIWREDVSEAFSISRDGADSTPDAFDLGGPVENVGTSTDVFSNIITVSGITAPASISVSGTGSPAYRIGEGTYTSSSGTVANGNTVQLRVTSAGTTNTSVTGTLNIGGVTDSFTVTTLQGGGGNTTIPSGTSDYGVEVYGASGVKLLSPETRLGNAVGNWTLFNVPANGSVLIPADMTGLTTSNSTLLILSEVVSIVFTVTRPQDNSGFLITNNTSNSYSGKAVPIRF